MREFCRDPRLATSRGRETVLGLQDVAQGRPSITITACASRLLSHQVTKALHTLSIITIVVFVRYGTPAMLPMISLSRPTLPFPPSLDLDNIYTSLAPGRFSLNEGICGRLSPRGQHPSCSSRGPRRGLFGRLVGGKRCVQIRHSIVL